ncbi:MAG TPA: amino acid ABC transporter permease [Actinomyces sp.]|jgi:polar amino acid transport system permease protein|nr:amino acid ABC transporter permease [Acidobacteriota bacterium]HHT40108.1 amino acid ABC transporter permease [Actinomyces sp.]
MSNEKIDLIHPRPVPRPGRWVSAAVVAVIAAMVINSLLTNPNFQWPVVWDWLFSNTIMTGVAYTLLLTVMAMAIGTVLAITMAIMRQSPNPILRGVSWFYIWFFRGTPIYTQLIFWSLLPTLYPQLSLGIPFGPEFVKFTTAEYFTPFWMAIVGLSLNEGAYLAEIIRSGLNAVDKGQWEAATALGMNRGKILRRIVLPQTMRVIIPPIGNETISMLKTTSLVAAIPFTLELTWAARDKGIQLFAPVPLLIAAAIWYLVITSILMIGQMYLERYFGKGFNQTPDKKSKKGAKGSKAASRQQAIKDAQTTPDDPFLDVTP